MGSGYALGAAGADELPPEEPPEEPPVLPVVRVEL